MRVVAYARVSTREQKHSGLSLEAQRAALTGAAQARGWTLARIIEEVGSGADMKKRPLLTVALAQLDAGDYDVLLVTRLDRLARSLGDFATTVDRARRNDWRLVMLDPAIDMADPWGQAMAGVAAVFAELERVLISQRTKAALDIARERGTFRPGERNRYTDKRTIARIVRWAERGVPQRTMVERLEAEGVPGPTNSGWHHRSIGRILRRERDRLAALEREERAA